MQRAEGVFLGSTRRDSRGEESGGGKGYILTLGPPVLGHVIVVRRRGVSL